MCYYIIKNWKMPILHQPERSYSKNVLLHNMCNHNKVSEQTSVNQSPNKKCEQPIAFSTTIIYRRFYLVFFADHFLA